MTLLSCLVACDKNGQPSANLGTGDTLPTFTATMNDGSVITDLDFNEKAGLIAFFNTNCPDCAEELPALQKIWEKYKMIVFCPISREQGSESIAEYWTDNGLSMPCSPQEDKTIYGKFASSGIPRIYVVYNGKIVKTWPADTVPSFETLDNCVRQTQSLVTTFKD